MLKVISGKEYCPPQPKARLRSRAMLMKWLKKRRGPVAMMLVSPAGLNGVNRLFGLSAGDEMIDDTRAIVARIAPENAIVAKFAGGKTAVALPIGDSAETAAIARLLRDSVEADDRDGRPMTVRIGGVWVAETGPQGAQPDMIAEAAITAYEDTASGGVSLIELDDTGEPDRLVIARRALASIKAGDAHIALQPVVAADGSGRVMFRESLLRIRGANGEEISAGQFMPALERFSMTEDADIAALRLVFDRLAAQEDLRLSVNISGHSIRRPTWASVFAELAARAPDCAARLIVEVTEEAALANASETAGLFAMIRAHGAALAIDDFGAGRTSFSHLRDFRFDMVKIDGGYIGGIDQKPDNRMLVSALVAIARQFDMVVIAEHVETAAEARTLRQLGVDGFQGFLFGRPALVWSEGANVARSFG